MPHEYAPLITDYELRHAAIKYSQIKEAGLERELREEIARRAIEAEDLDHCIIGYRTHLLILARELSQLFRLTEERCITAVEDAMMRTRGRIVMECLDEFSRAARARIRSRQTVMDNTRQ
jgi:hypothetical protein